VTADDQLRRVDDDHDPELFGALRAPRFQRLEDLHGGPARSSSSAT
jgi:hypothetical protein